MPVIIAEENFILSQSEGDALWLEVQRECHCPDDIVTIKGVDEEEIRRLNRQYRKLDKVTNVLTFSYGEGEHDIAICLAVAKREAAERKMTVHSYMIMLVTHALVHAAGWDHEASAEEAKKISAVEDRIRRTQGLPPVRW